MGKRIRYPKDKKEKQEVKQEEQKIKFVLDVHNASIGNTSKIGK